MDDMLVRHRQEKKELQANIQKMKQLVPKNDKKRRKEMTQKIDEMESELKKRQDEEIKEMNRTCNPSSVEPNDDKPIVEKLEQLQVTLEKNQFNFDQQSQGKVSKAQKRREKKERENLEKEQRLREDEENSVNHVRMVEKNDFDKIFKENNLTLYDIPSDGDCMYKAIEHQLNTNNVYEHNVESMRKMVADSLRNEKDEYLPFLTNSVRKDELLNDQEFEQYCIDLETTKKWGGNVELRLLSEALKVNVNVYLSTGQVLDFKGKNPIIEKPLLISFHKYLYHLGGHYNSLLKNNLEEQH